MNAQTLIATLADRWARQGYPQFVWWIPAVMYVSSTFAFLAAIVQRVGQDAVLPAAGWSSSPRSPGSSTPSAAACTGCPRWCSPPRRWRR